MILEIACYTIALTAAAWAVWVRRGCWRIPFERTTTSAIVQLGVALVLISPAAQPVIGRLLWEVTGRWHVDDLLGHMLALGALVSSNLAGLMRMPSMRQRIVPLLWHPLVVGTAVLYFLFWHSAVTHNPGNDLYRLQHDWWLSVYFMLFWALLVYYGGLLEGDNDTTGGEVVPPSTLLTPRTAETNQRDDNVDTEGPSL